VALAIRDMPTSLIQPGLVATGPNGSRETVTLEGVPDPVDRGSICTTAFVTNCLTEEARRLRCTDAISAPAQPREVLACVIDATISRS
jgi:hypothetical protein